MSMLDAERSTSNEFGATKSTFEDSVVNNPQRPYIETRVVDLNAPAFETKDIAAFLVGAFMMLGPLVAVAVGGGS